MNHGASEFLVLTWQWVSPSGPEPPTQCSRGAHVSSRQVSVQPRGVREAGGGFLRNVNHLLGLVCLFVL